MYNDSDLNSYYGRIWELADNTKATTIQELEMMIPYEIDVYTGLLIQRLKRDEKNRKRQ